MTRVVHPDPATRFGLLGASVGHNVEYGYRCPKGPPGALFPVESLERAWWTKERPWGETLLPDERASIEPEVERALGGPPPVQGDLVAVDFRCPKCQGAVVVVFTVQTIDSKAWEWFDFEPVDVFEIERE